MRQQHRPLGSFLGSHVLMIVMDQKIRMIYLDTRTNATLTTQGDATDPVNRLYPKRIVPWLDFPQLQEQIWRKFGRTFTAPPLFPSDTQIDYIVTKVQNRPIYWAIASQHTRRRKRLFGILSETQWVTLSKRSFRRCEMMNPFGMSLESRVEVSVININCLLANTGCRLINAFKLRSEVWETTEKVGA